MTNSIAPSAQTVGKLPNIAGPSRRGLIAGIALLPALGCAGLAASSEWDRITSAYKAAEAAHRAAWAMAARVPFGPHAAYETECERLAGVMNDLVDRLVVIPAPDMEAFAQKLELALADDEMVAGHARHLIADARRLGGRH
ncbi:MAG: hypothetical protein V4618_00875 [Pseudomonadota bacterium]